MSDTNHAVVLEGSDGGLYVLPIETLEASRVADDLRATVESDLGEVEGFAVSVAPFRFMGTMTVSESRVKTSYGASPWPCDTPVQQLPGAAQQQR